jgi:hypothetical protein
LLYGCREYISADVIGWEKSLKGEIRKKWKKDERHGKFMLKCNINENGGKYR